VVTSVLFSCGDDNPATPGALSAQDADKFIGSWAGTYQCGNPPTDTLIIAKGANDLTFRVTLHAEAFNAEEIHGELTEVNVLTIPEQTIAGFPGSGKITYSNGRLSLSQTGFGITCLGTDYQKL
jgi:hypothetical protein